MWEQFTERARRAIFYAQEEAARLGENHVRTEHILLALIRDPENLATTCLKNYGITADDIWQQMGARLRYGRGKLGDNMQLSPKAKLAMDAAAAEAQEQGSSEMNTGHLLLGLLSVDGLAGRTLTELGVVAGDLRKGITNVSEKVRDAEPPVSVPSTQAHLPFTNEEMQSRLLSRNIQLVLSGMENIRTQLTRDSGIVSEGLRGRDVISIHDLSAGDISQIFATSYWLKHHRDLAPNLLDGKTLAMIFEKPSLRTRVSFDTGMFQLGGHALYLSPDEIQLGKRESVPDAAHVLERMVQGIMARTFSHQMILDLAKAATIPVINGLSDLEHPCQALADFFTVKEKKQSLRGLKFAYIGDGNNVCHSLMLTAAKVGSTFWAATPQGYEPDEKIVQMAREDAKETRVSINLTEDPFEAARNADVIYTDTWVSMGEESEKEQRLQVFQPYQINTELVKYAKPDAIILHCLPAYRGVEITDEVIDSPQSVVFDEAENRLHVQKAVMALTM